MKRLLLLLLVCEPLWAQILDSRGREFWLTFLPNYHNQRRSADSLSDSLYLFIIAEAPTRGYLEWWTGSSQPNRLDFQIVDPRQPATVAFSWYPLELMGYNDSGRLLIAGAEEGGEGERPVRKSVHIVVTEGSEVTVYALQKALYTSDAMLVLPVDVLGQEYLVLSYPSDGSVAGATIGGQSTPSQFAIVAVEDSTEVRIRPAAPTYRNGLNEQRIWLQRGEVYLVQARITPQQLRPDLTGTEVLSSKPIALFAGHQRAKVPVQVPELTSRDILLEQLPPVTAWGRSALLAPFPLPSTGNRPSNRGQHVFRILAALDSTVVYINEQPVASLSRGQFYEGRMLDQPLAIRATGPILVAQFHRTVNESNLTESIGDPFMLLIPPVQQFMPFYRFVAAQHYRRGNFGQIEPIFQEQYATVVLPNGATVWLDGAQVPPTLYVPIGGSGYSYVWLSLSDGVHEVWGRYADGSLAPIGLYVYGYGSADSYGYVGGASFRPLDIHPPTVVAAAECFGVRGVVYDTAASDSRLLRVEIVQPENVEVAFDPLPAPADSVRFRARLVDVYQDGSFTLRAVDSVGYERTWSFDIPGFTLALSPARIDTELVEDGQQHCWEFVLSNTGRFVRRIQGLRLVGMGLPSELTLEDSVLEPGQRTLVRLCVQAERSGEFRAAIVLEDSCLVDTAASVLLRVGRDELPPRVARQLDSCGIRALLLVSDEGVPNSGVAEVVVQEAVNCRVEVEQSTPQLVRLWATVLDPFEDAWYALRLRDGAGNERLVRDTIPGFTLRIVEPAEGELRMGPVASDALTCTLVQVRNVGHFPVELRRVWLRQSLAFSVPMAQLPLLVPPKELRELLLCFAAPARAPEVWYDTLVLGFGCQELELLVRGELQQEPLRGKASCEVELRGGAPERNFLQQVTPQPVEHEAATVLGLASAQSVEVVLSDALGRTVATLHRGSYGAGVYRLWIRLPALPAGLYWLNVRLAGELLTQPVVLVR
jgi:hypothetical protein